MEMLGEVKTEAGRIPQAARHRREEPRAKRRSIGRVSTITASALRRAADRLDPAPPRTRASYRFGFGVDCR
jgi:hypothetical protein